MRKCADIAEHFSQVIMHLGPNTALPPIPQFHTLPMPDPKQMVAAPPPTTTMSVSTNGKRKAQLTADGETKKRKVKKLRDPEAPKRPPSSYLLFQNEVRQAMKRANPGMANHEILTSISQRWAAMTPEEKDVRCTYSWNKSWLTFFNPDVQ
jgi:transcriptional regulator HMO1